MVYENRSVQKLSRNGDGHRDHQQQQTRRARAFPVGRARGVKEGDGFARVTLLALASFVFVFFFFTVFPHRAGR